MPREIARFGDGFVTRAEGSDDDWESIAKSKMTKEERAEIVELQGRKDRVKQHGYDPENPPRPFVTRG